MKTKVRKIRLKAETIGLLTTAQMERAKGGVIVETEPYSACGMCVPITYMTCRCAL